MLYYMISTNPIISQILILETSHFCARTVTKGWGCADLVETHIRVQKMEMDMMVVQFCFSLSHTRNFREILKGNGLKKLSRTAIFHSL